MTMQTGRRVVVTGMGTLNLLGSTLDEFYQNLLKGRSGIKRWSSLDVANIESQIGGDMGDFDFKAALVALKGRIPEAKVIRLTKMFRSCTFANKTAIMSSLYAMLDAGLTQADIDPHRTSVIVAGHDLNHNYILGNTLRFYQDKNTIDTLCGVEALDSNVAATLSEVLGTRGPLYLVGGACASGNLAMRDGYRDIVSGEVDRAFVAGPAFDITSGDIHAMCYLGAVVTAAEFQHRPEIASRPFDTRRCGFVPSHGSGMIVLEDLESAKRRGATIYGELLGVRASCDGSRLPSPSAENQSRLIGDLLKQTGTQPDEVDYVNCHATSTKIGDVEEIQAIKLAFGDHAKKMFLNAPKSMLGHLTWSAAIVETIAGLLQMKHGVLHPSTNIDELDPSIDLDVCANTAREHKINCFLKNSFGFGGINCCSLFKRYEH